MLISRKKSLVLVLVLLLSGCATVKNVDPYESINRKVMKFNDHVDGWTLKPIAKGYVAVTPEPIRASVNNIFSNLGEPTVIINQFLQGKIQLGFQDTARFIINSTIGLVGIFDVASGMGFIEHEEDFGQTFASWGVDSGAYIVIPFLGPVTTRDGTGDILASFTYPPRYIDHVRTRNQVLGVAAINRRADLLDAEALISGDRYLFVRDAYLQNREFLISDGVIGTDDFLDATE